MGKTEEGTGTGDLGEEKGEPAVGLGEGGPPGAWGQNRALPLAAAAASEGGWQPLALQALQAVQARCELFPLANTGGHAHVPPRYRFAPHAAAQALGEHMAGTCRPSGATLPVAFFPRVSASQAAAMARHRHQLRHRHRHEQSSQRHPQSRPYCSGRTLAAQANGPCIRRSQRQWPGWSELLPALDIRWRQGPGGGTGGGPGALELSSSGWRRRGERAGTRAGTQTCQIALAVCSAPKCPSGQLTSHWRTSQPCRPVNPVFL